MKFNKLFLVVLVILSLFSISAVNAATEEEIEQAITSGIVWLASIQKTDGSWEDAYAPDEDVGVTAMAVLKLEDRAYELGYSSPLDPAYSYASNVQKGLDYIDNYVQSDGSIWNPSSGYHQNYNTALAIMALCKSGDSAYYDELQNAVNYLKSEQNPDGGWNYGIFDDPASDQSNTGYVTLGLVYAMNEFGIDISPTYPGLENWVTSIQDPVNGDTDDGASYYMIDWPWPNLLKTGHLCYQFAMLGDSSTDTRVVNAIDYIERHWNDPDLDPGWRPHHYQSMFCMMKGFEALGIDMIDVDGDGTPETDWFDQFTTAIVQSQESDGSWPGDYWGGNVLATEWALLTIEKVVEPVNNQPPIANAGPDQNAIRCEVVTFDGSGSSDPDGTIDSYAWDFGDGATGTGSTATHPYSAAGTFTVILTVTDNGGLTATDTATVTVVTPTEGINELKITLKDMHINIGMERTLLSYLDSAQKMINMGMCKQAVTSLQSFNLNVNGMRGRGLTPDQADTLIAYSNRIIASIQQCGCR